MKLLFPKKNNVSEEEYRNLRIKYLEAYSMSVKVFYPKAKDIIGIATENELMSKEYISKDVMYINGRQWNEKKQKEAKWLCKELKIFTNPEKKIIHSSEFPSQNKNN